MLLNLSHERKTSGGVQNAVVIEPFLSELRTALMLVWRKRPSPSTATSSAKGQHCAMVADRVDTLRLSSSLLPAMLFSLWAVTHWLVHTIQQALSSEDLSLLAWVIFEHVPLTVEASRILVEELNMTGIGTMQLPVHCPQYWLLKSSTDQYNNVRTWHQWLQVRQTTVCSG